jgi:hypothetical protein
VIYQMDNKIKEFIKSNKLADADIMKALEAYKKTPAEPQPAGEEDGEDEEADGESATESPTLSMADLKKMMSEVIDEKLKPKAKTGKAAPTPQPSDGGVLKGFRLIQ